jgi:type VI protein secretion system component VasF
MTSPSMIPAARMMVMMDQDLASRLALGLAALCTCASVALAVWHIYMHLKNYTEPTYQRYTVRIIFMVPVSEIC